MAVSIKASSEKIISTNNLISKNSIGTDYTYKHEIIWTKAFAFLILYSATAYCFIYYFFSAPFWPFLIFGHVCALGINVGAHRYFTHRTFKATRPLQVVMLVLFTGTGQDSLFRWVRDHRLHHRYSDTDGDPHNAKRGFFFSHVGWLMCKKHPYVNELGRKIDMSDLQADPLVMFQKKYHWYLFFLIGVLIPTCVPVYFWEMSWLDATLCNFLRHGLILNGTLLVNSAAHLYGTRPYDKNLQPVESWFVSLVALGEGYHNYHHTFPWDYRAAEKDMHLNFSTIVINFLAAIGQAYDLKMASPETVEKRILRTGDGTHYQLGDDDSRASVKAWGPLHPLNPTYTTTKMSPNATLKPTGLPLYHENDLLDMDCLKNFS